MDNCSARPQFRQLTAYATYCIAPPPPRPRIMPEGDSVLGHASASISRRSVCLPFMRQLSFFAWRRATGSSRGYPSTSPPLWSCGALLQPPQQFSWFRYAQCHAHLNEHHAGAHRSQLWNPTPSGIAACHAPMGAHNRSWTSAMASHFHRVIFMIVCFSACLVVQTYLRFHCTQAVPRCVSHSHSTGLTRRSSTCRRRRSRRMHRRSSGL